MADRDCQSNSFETFRTLIYFFYTDDHASRTSVGKGIPNKSRRHFYDFASIYAYFEILQKQDISRFRSDVSNEIGRLVVETSPTGLDRADCESLFCLSYAVAWMRLFGNRKNPIGIRSKGPFRRVAGDYFGAGQFEFPFPSPRFNGYRRNGSYLLKELDNGPLFAKLCRQSAI